MKDIPLNVDVICDDGKCGKTSHVIINPLNQAITHVVVQNKEFLMQSLQGETPQPRRADRRLATTGDATASRTALHRFLGSNKRLVPFARIIASSHKYIQLNCTKEQLAEMEKFTETHYYIDHDATEYQSSGLLDEHMLDELDPFLLMWPYVYADDNLYSIPEEDELIPTGEMAVRRGAAVKATDGYVGKVNEFIVDPQNDCITHLVLREGHLWGKKELTLPLSAIASMEEDIVHLKLNKEAVRSLPAVPIRRFYNNRSE